MVVSGRPVLHAFVSKAVMMGTCVVWPVVILATTQTLSLDKAKVFVVTPLIPFKTERT